MLCAIMTLILVAVLLALLALAMAGLVLAVLADGSPARMVELARLAVDHLKRPA